MSHKYPLWQPAVRRRADAADLSDVVFGLRFHRYLMIRTTDGRSAITGLRPVLQELAPNLPILAAHEMTDVTGIGMFPQRIVAWAASGMGLIGLLLASLGVYGFTAFAVASRTRELGLRSALGAARGSILRLVAAEALSLAALGVIIGCLVSLVITPVVRSLLWDINPTDPLTFVVIRLAWLPPRYWPAGFPARRAIRLDPAVLLRDE
jgi:hypothetical protein